MDALITSPAPGKRRRSLGARLWVYLGLAVVSLVNLVSQAPLQPNAHEKAWGDALNYYEMSERTGAPVDNPFALRMLSPWLAHVLNHLTGISLDRTWLGLTLLFTLASTIVFFEFLRSHLKLQMFTSVLCAVALGCTFWYGPYAFSNPYLVDPLNNLLYVIAIWLLVRQRLVWFTVVVVIGTINKETTLLLAPLYPLLAWTRRRTLRDRHVQFGVLAIVVAAAAYFGFRLWAQHLIGGNYGFGSGQANAGLWNNIMFALSSNKGHEQSALYDTFHFFWLIFAFGLYRQYRLRGLRSDLLVSSLWLLGCCFAGRLVATDTQRVFVMMAPLVIAVVAVVVDRQSTDARRLWTGLLMFLYVALNFRWVPSPVSFLVEVGGMMLFAVLMFPPSWPGLFVRRHRESHDPASPEFVPHEG